MSSSAAVTSIDLPFPLLGKEEGEKCGRIDTAMEGVVNQERRTERSRGGRNGQKCVERQNE